jgi:phosphate starvation-inducible membrane PsiE
MLVIMMADIANSTNIRLQRANRWVRSLVGGPNAQTQAAVDIARRQSVTRAQARTRMWQGLTERAQVVVTALIVVISLALWGDSLRYVDISAMNDLGFVSVLPIGCYIALGALTLGFCIALLGGRERAPGWILAFCLLALIFMLYGLPTLVEQSPRFQVVYWLAGHTDYLLSTGTVDPNFDAYFNWPGFFVLTGMLTQLAGLKAVTDLTPWASLLYNILYLPPIYMIYTTATRDRRLIWLGLWMFYITDWVWQDYFSPQGLNLFLYLLIIALLLKWFKTSHATAKYSTVWTSPDARMIAIETRPVSVRATLKLVQARARAVVNSGAHPVKTMVGAGPRLRAWFALYEGPSSQQSRRRRIGLVVVILGIFLFSVSSHPITPFFIILSVAALAYCGQITPRWLPILMAVIVIGWDTTIAWPYMAGHIVSDLSSFGNLGASTTANVSDHLSVGSAQHQFVAQVRVLLTAAVWGLAVLGAALRWRRDSIWYAGDASWGSGSLFAHDIKYIVLAVSPMIMVAVQPYGGEMAMRSFLFTLPLVAFFAAAAFCTPDVGMGLRFSSALSTVVTAGACLILLAAFMFARYGNERADYYTYNESAAVAYVYSVAPADSLFLQGWIGTPWRYTGLESYVYFPLYPGYGDARALRAHRIEGIINIASREQYPRTYIIFTRSQRAQAEMFYSVPASDFDTVEQDLLATGKFVLIYHNPDADVLVYVREVNHGPVILPPFSATPIAQRWLGKGHPG